MRGRGVNWCGTEGKVDNLSNRSLSVKKTALYFTIHKVAL